MTTNVATKTAPNAAPPVSRDSTAPLVAFVAVLIALVGAFASGALNEVVGKTLGGDASATQNLKDYLDVYVFLAIILLGSVAAYMRANTVKVMAIGTFAAFLVLTLHVDALSRYLTLSAVLFAIGVYGMVVSRNAVRVLMSIELLLNAVNINLVAFARYIDPVEVRGQLFAIFILTVAAAEAAVGLAIVLAIYRNMSTVDMDEFNLLKW